MLDVLYGNQSEIGLHLFEMVESALLTGDGRDEAAIWLPLTQQLFYATPYGQLNTSHNEDSYHVSLAQHSIQLFTIFSAIILISCFALLGTSSQNRTPEFSAFPDLDLISKIPAATPRRDLYDISAKLSKTDPLGIVREFDGVKVYAQPGYDRIMNMESTDTETYELTEIMD